MVLHLSLSAAYARRERELASHMRIADAALLEAFIVADMNALCRDSRITASAVRGYIRAKTGLQGGAPTELLGIPSLGELIDKNGQRWPKREFDLYGKRSR